MKRNIISIFIAAVCIFTAASAVAQDFRTGYFLDGYVYRYRLNPAFQNETGFFGFSPISNLGVKAESNMGISTFLYPRNEGFTTAFSPNVSSSEFLGKLDRRNRVGMNMNMNVLAVGFRTKSLYHTIDIDTRTNMAVSIPYDVFRFLKDGTSKSSSFDLSDMNMCASSYLQVAYGLSKNFSDKLTVGFRVKAIAGVARANVNFDKADLVLDEDQWSLTSIGSVEISTGGAIDYSTKPSDVRPGMNSIDFSTLQVGDYRPKSYGFGLDLGVTWKVLPNLTLSASVLDMGTVNWANCLRGSTLETTIKYEPADDLELSGPSAGDKIGDQFKAAFDNIGSLYEFFPGADADILEKLPMNVNVGLEFFVPRYKALSFGLLGTWRNENIYSSYEVRLSANWAPLKWLGLSVCGTNSTFGWNCGAALNVHTRGFKFFIGSDSMLMRVNRQFIPVGKINSDVRFGVNFGFGQRHEVK